MSAVLRIDSALLPGVIHVRTPQYLDSRGWFMELWNERVFGKMVQMNVAYSVRHTLRGLHLQAPHQGKLVHCLHGEIYDVALDPDSGKWCGVGLKDSAPSALWIPKGYAHGYYVVSDSALVCYAVDEYRNQSTETTLPWHGYGIEWPLFGEPILSTKDDI